MKVLHIRVIGANSEAHSGNSLMKNKAVATNFGANDLYVEVRRSSCEGIFINTASNTDFTCRTPSKNYKSN